MMQASEVRMNNKQNTIMRNPIFDFIEEGMDSKAIIESMGFEFAAIRADEDEYDPEQYMQNPWDFLCSWDVEISGDDYKIAWKTDTEDGAVAVFAKPKTNFAKVLLEFGESKAAQDAMERDDKIRAEEFALYMKEKLAKARAKKKVMNHEG